MVGKLTLEQICLLSGESERIIKKDLKQSRLVDQSPKEVGLWLKSRIEGTIEKRYKTKSSVFRKWD